jgi:DNA primase
MGPPQAVSPAQGGGGGMAPINAHERRERLIVLTIINHPQLLDDHADRFAEVDFSMRALDSLRREILDVAALREGLDRPALKDHLVSRGFGAELARLEAQGETSERMVPECQRSGG